MLSQSQAPSEQDSAAGDGCMMAILPVDAQHSLREQTHVITATASLICKVQMQPQWSAPPGRRRTAARTPPRALAACSLRPPCSVCPATSTKAIGCSSHTSERPACIVLELVLRQEDATCCRRADTCSERVDTIRKALSNQPADFQRPLTSSQKRSAMGA